MSRTVPGTLGPVAGRELRTIREMVLIHCRAHHPRGTFCFECSELLDYASQRLDRCVYGEEKPTCVTCPIHCYHPRMRERVRQVMRFAGPRMLLHHPLLAIAHLVKDRHPAPPRPGRREEGPELCP
jgi:hypothetical protein